MARGTQSSSSIYVKHHKKAALEDAQQNGRKGKVSRTICIHQKNRVEESVWWNIQQ